MRFFEGNEKRDEKATRDNTFNGGERTKGIAALVTWVFSFNYGIIWSVYVSRLSLSRVPQSIRRELVYGF